MNKSKTLNKFIASILLMFVAISYVCIISASMAFVNTQLNIEDENVIKSKLKNKKNTINTNNKKYNNVNYQNVLFTTSNVLRVETQTKAIDKNSQSSHSKVGDEKCNLNHVDKYLLIRIAMAEAEGESIEGKALVMNVVLNRVKSDKFPNSIKEVIYQKNQFSPILNGRFDKVKPNSDCWKALNKVKSGWNESRGALYFTSEKGNNTWHHRNLEYMFTYENHRFYK